MNSEFENGHLVAALVRSVGGYQSEKRAVRVHLVVNYEDPHGIYLVPRRQLDPATGEVEFLGYHRVPVEIIPKAIVETHISDEDLAQQWFISFTPTGDRRDPTYSFQQ